MNAKNNPIPDWPETCAKPTPFSQVPVTLSKQEYIALRWEANYWKSQHQRAVDRMQQLESEHRYAIENAKLREAALCNELANAQARIKELQKRVFGRKSEQRKHGDKVPGTTPVQPKPRGQQKGTPGHGRTLHANLPEQHETIELDDPCCSKCGLGFTEFPGTEDGELVEIEVQAYKRIYHRKRYCKCCDCEGVPGIITAPPPARLIPKGKYGITIWVHLLLSKFLYGQPTHRLLKDLSHSGLNLSQGTLTGGLNAIAPMFAPLEAAMHARLCSEAQWHADETRWLVFITLEGKAGHRWYLWVFQSKSVIHYVLDPTRSAQVPIAELSKAAGGIIICDRYSAYKKLARLYPHFTLAFCWAHQRRDFLELGNSHSELMDWVLGWVDKIGELYQLNDARLAVPRKSADFVEQDRLLRQSVDKMALAWQDGFKSTQKKSITKAAAQAASKVLQSMGNHWAGLTVFVDNPDVPMDNNTAERSVRQAVVGRKNFYGSGSQWSGELAATMYGLLMTLQLWGINPRTWLSAYLNACAENGNAPPADLSSFLPWAMNEQQMAAMKQAFAQPCHTPKEGNDSS